MVMTEITLSETTFNEIAEELIRTGREDEIIFEADRSVTLNMHGISIIRKAPNVVQFPSRTEGDQLADIRKGFE